VSAAFYIFLESGLRLTGCSVECRSNIDSARVLFSSSGKPPYRFVFEVTMVQNCHFSTRPKNRWGCAIQQTTHMPCFRSILRVRVVMRFPHWLRNLRVTGAEIVNPECRFAFTNGRFMPTSSGYEVWHHTAIAKLKKSAASCQFNRQTPPLYSYCNNFIMRML